VKISMGARKGNIRIEFGSVDDLERIVGVIARGLQTDLSLGG
jgi:ParB family chromosome partitioning protein